MCAASSAVATRDMFISSVLAYIKSGVFSFSVFVAAVIVSAVCCYC